MALEHFDLNSWEGQLTAKLQDDAINALESGKIVFLPKLYFPLCVGEQNFLSPKIVDPKSKNISYNLKNDRLGGTVCQSDEREQLKSMIKRYALSSKELIEGLFPQYVPFLNQARTSFRPVEAAGRNISCLKDDTLLHVDSFPATPIQGNRILRVFTNVNPEGRPRVWRIGEPFEQVVNKFSAKVTMPFPGQAYFLKFLKITKDYRTLYDHIMLGMHDAMKQDQTYQNNVQKEEIQFPAGSTWIVYTDQVSHAALSGQHLFEQTFYLPPQAMKNPETVPLNILQKHFKKKLI